MLGSFKHLSADARIPSRIHPFGNQFPGLLRCADADGHLVQNAAVPRSTAETDSSPHAPSRQPELLRALGPPVLLLTLAVLTYINTGHERFEFDSAGTMIVNSQTRDLAGSLRRLISGPLAGDGRLSILSFSLNCALNEALGRDAFDVTSFLVINVLIHAVNAWLVFLLVRALLARCEPQQPPPTALPLALACIFVVHPIHASSVAYIVQRRGALATTFYVLGVLAFLRARDMPWGPRQWAWIGATAACCWLSFQSKSMGMTLPVALLAIELCLRMSGAASLRRTLCRMAAGLILCGFALIAFLWRHGMFDPTSFRLGAQGSAQLWSPWVHVLTEARVFLHFWKLLLLPLPAWSAIDHNVALSQSLFEPATLAAVAVHLALITIAFIAAARRWTPTAIGILWFYIALIPYTILPQTELLVEYKTYLPSVGLLLIAADVFRHISPRIPAPVRWGAAIAVPCMLLVTTLRRNVIYQDQVTMWRDAVEKNPDFARPRLNLGMALLDQGRHDDAEAWFHEVLRISKAQEQRIAQGDALFQEAPRMRLNLAGAHISLGIIDKSRGRLSEAESHFREGIRLAPDEPTGFFNLAAVLIAQQRTDEAIDQFRRGLAVSPEFPDAQFLLALALEDRGRIDEARAAYAETLRRAPGHTEARQRLERLGPPPSRPP